jgi:hypothetical protein
MSFIKEGNVKPELNSSIYKITIKELQELDVNLNYVKSNRTNKAFVIYGFDKNGNKLFGEVTRNNETVNKYLDMII